MRLHVLALSAATLAASACAAIVWPVDAPSYKVVRADFRTSEATLLDRHGIPLQGLRVDASARRLTWTPLRDVSPALEQAIVASEDRRFYEHAGVDWQALAGSAWENLWRARPRGASTLTMQLAGLLDPDLRPSRRGRSYLQKWRQIRMALSLERQWSKAQILEAYLNLVTFRGELQGVRAASRGLFDKAPEGLNRAEAALLAALVRGPNAAAPAVARRGCGLEPEIPCARLQGIATAALTGAPALRSRFGAAPHLARTLLERPGTAVRTTLDADLQRFARETLLRQLLELEGRSVEDGAVIVLDNASGDILAYVASSGPLSTAADVDGITAHRQAGSTLKPFLYSLAIERRWLTAASVLDDAPLDIATPLGGYTPQNYDHRFRGPVSVRTALASSLNVPAVRALMLAGCEAFYDRLKALGFDSLVEPAEFYGYALALGGADVSLLELANAYRALANSGVWSAVRATFDERPPGRQVVDRTAAFIVGDILSDRAARAVTFGLASPLAAPYWAAVKTGTSKDMRDNWAVGYSTRYTVGVWVGNFSGAPMHDVSGISGAAPVWRAVMDALQRGTYDRAPEAPAGVVARTVRYLDGVEPSRQEYFIAGTEVGEVRLGRPDQGPAQIAEPGDGSIFALDPDIPTDRQRIAFATTGSPGTARWLLDDRTLGAAREPLLWHPLAGNHRLALVDPSGRELDAVRFQVRGRAP